MEPAAAEPDAAAERNALMGAAPGHRPGEGERRGGLMVSPAARAESFEMGADGGAAGGVQQQAVGTVVGTVVGTEAREEHYDPICAICLSEPTPKGERDVVMTPCSHTYCRECLRQAVAAVRVGAQLASCPVCRGVLPDSWLSSTTLLPPTADPASDVGRLRLLGAATFQCCPPCAADRGGPRVWASVHP